MASLNAPQIGPREARWELSRQQRLAQAIRFEKHGHDPWGQAALEALKHDIERLAPKERADDLKSSFRDLEKRALSPQQRYFVYLTLWERLRHRGKLSRKRRPGRPRKGTGPVPRGTILQVMGKRLVELRHKLPDLWQARLFSDLYAFLKPVYGPEKVYERVAQFFYVAFGSVIEADSVKREILRNRRL